MSPVFDQAERASMSAAGAEEEVDEHYGIPDDWEKFFPSFEG